MLAQPPHHTCQVIVGTNAVRACAETESVCRRRCAVQEFPRILLGAHDTRKPEYREGRVIGMDGHLQSFRFCNGNDLLQKIKKTLTSSKQCIYYPVEKQLKK